jgi:IstB-like ATP binding protein
LTSSLPVKRSSMPVWIGPGATALTRFPELPTSSATDLVSPSTACFPTGFGKNWLACALGDQACRDNRLVLYQRVPKLFTDLALARGDGRYARLPRMLSRIELLIWDDWGSHPRRMVACTGVLPSFETHRLRDAAQDEVREDADMIRTSKTLHWACLRDQRSTRRGGSIANPPPRPRRS